MAGRTGVVRARATTSAHAGGLSGRTGVRAAESARVLRGSGRAGSGTAHAVTLDIALLSRRARNILRARPLRARPASRRARKFLAHVRVRVPALVIARASRRPSAGSALARAAIVGQARRAGRRRALARGRILRHPRSARRARRADAFAALPLLRTRARIVLARPLRSGSALSRRAGAGLAERNRREPRAVSSLVAAALAAISLRGLSGRAGIGSANRIGIGSVHARLAARARRRDVLVLAGAMIDRVAFLPALSVRAGIAGLAAVGREELILSASRRLALATAVESLPGTARASGQRRAGLGPASASRLVARRSERAGVVVLARASLSDRSSRTSHRPRLERRAGSVLPEHAAFPGVQPLEIRFARIVHARPVRSRPGLARRAGLRNAISGDQPVRLHSPLLPGRARAVRVRAVRNSVVGGIDLRADADDLRRLGRNASAVLRIPGVRDVDRIARVFRIRSRDIRRAAGAATGSEAAVLSRRAGSHGRIAHAPLRVPGLARRRAGIAVLRQSVRAGEHSRLAGARDQVHARVAERDLGIDDLAEAVRVQLLPIRAGPGGAGLRVDAATDGQALAIRRPDHRPRVRLTARSRRSRRARSLLV